MRKQPIFRRILFPTILILLLLPPISCLVFQYFAERNAYAEAARDLKALQQSILPLMSSSFSASAADEHGDLSREAAGMESPANTGALGAQQTQVTAFLRKVSALIQSRGGNADVLILESHLAAVYPRDELAREALAPLTAVCTEYIQSNTAALDESRTAELQTETGEPYLVAFYEMPTPMPQLQYLITYCPISQINSWVQNAARLVFLISAAFVLLALVSLGFAARSIAQPLHRLCREAERIGGGNFVDIEPDFALRELEELRGSMNQMSDQLMRSDEIQRSFFQNVSHELRNPLMSISGYAQGIEQGIFRSSKEAAHTILEESVRLTELVNSLLTLSRMESDQQKSMLGPLPVADPIEDSLDRLNGLALQKGISLVLAPFDRGVTACAEEDLLGKVLDNLLTNAIRYAKTAVTVSVWSRDGQVTISVADDGDGIAEKDLPHLFERCYKGKGGNFGIGLAIARSAAQKMEGELTAANQINGGAIFTLTLKCSI